MQGIKIAIGSVGARLDVVLLTIRGYVDTTTCQELSKIIQELVKKGRYQIIADLGGVSYISSAGWGVFVGEIKNIRDQGGDLKIVQMNPEVYEVFEMLEFNRILNYYDTLEEAINEFDVLRGIDITNPEENKKKKVANDRAGESKPATPLVIREERKIKSGDAASKPAIPVKELPLLEKIKLIVLDNPFLSTGDICKQLGKKKYGNVRMGWFRMRSLLKQINLESKEKRYRFYRSR